LSVWLSRAESVSCIVRVVVEKGICRSASLYSPARNATIPHPPLQINCDVARLGLKVVKAQNKDMQQFTQKDFVIRLVQRYNLMDDDEDDSRRVNLDWAKMRGEAASFFDATPSCHFLAGA